MTDSGEAIPSLTSLSQYRLPFSSMKFGSIGLPRPSLAVTVHPLAEKLAQLKDLAAASVNRVQQPECPGCRERDARIAALEERVAELEGRLNDLIKPPVPPRPGAALPKGPAKKPSGKKPGGQPGHPPHLKLLLPSERVKRTVTYVPEECEHCHEPLPKEAGPHDPPPTRHQVAELPELAAEITEYQGHARTCPCCDNVTRAAIPEAIRAHSVGPRLTAALSYFAGCHGVSKRGVEEISEAMFQAPDRAGDDRQPGTRDERGVGAGSSRGDRSRSAGTGQIRRRDGLEAGGQQALAVGGGHDHGRGLHHPRVSQRHRLAKAARADALRHSVQRPLECL